MNDQISMKCWHDTHDWDIFCCLNPRFMYQHNHSKLRLGIEVLVVEIISIDDVCGCTLNWYFFWLIPRKHFRFTIKTTKPFRFGWWVIPRKTWYDDSTLRDITKKLVVVHPFKPDVFTWILCSWKMCGFHDIVMYVVTSKICLQRCLVKMANSVRNYNTCIV